MIGGALLVKNTKLANADDFLPVGGGLHDASKNADFLPVGLVRVSYAPRGVIVENLEKSDMAVYRRFLRWRRLRVIQHMLSFHKDKSSKAKDGRYRVTKCFRVMFKKNVAVNYSPKVKRAHYGNLVICGGVWVCPICAAKITERRRAELEGAKDDGLSKFMVTYTIQHNKQDKLKKMIEEIVRAHV